MLDKSASDRESTKGDDFDLALARAEMLLEKIDRSRQHARWLRSLQGVIPLVVALALTLTAETGGVTLLKTLTVAVICGAITILAIGWIQISVLRPIARRIGRDERAMLEIVGVLREILGSVADNEHWSAGRQWLARTRIARFPIGPKGAR